MKVGTSLGSTDDKPAFYLELDGLDESREERAKKKKVFLRREILAKSSLER